MRQAMPAAVCVDTSVWIEHFRGNTRRLQAYLDSNPAAVRVHELIILELALGGMVNREEKLSFLKNLAVMPNVSSEELLEMVKTHDLAGAGIGCVDSHILASCLLTNTLLWTNDHKLAELADRFHVLYRER
jgi:predicted nucleic acid-binding protein